MSLPSGGLDRAGGSTVARPGLDPKGAKLYTGSMNPVLYGIANCDTVAKARSWLASTTMAYDFHDYKKAGVDPERLRHWCEIMGWETVLNRAGTTFKKLPEDDKVNLSAERAVALMTANPSMIKRPILEYPGGLLIGFRPDAWATALT